MSAPDVVQPTAAPLHLASVPEKPSTPSPPRFSVYKSNDRGTANMGWLQTRYSFAFGAKDGFGPLRVFNEDIVQPSKGFDTHPHKEFEIFSYIVKGKLKHKDSMGNTHVLPRGAVQFTSAGTGIQHSEKNASAFETVHFLQIWSLPDTSGLTPSYATLRVGDTAKTDTPAPVPLIVPTAVHARLAADKNTFRGSDAGKLIGIHQDLYFFASVLSTGQTTRHVPVGDRRIAYIHVVASGNGSAVEVEAGGGKVRARLEEGDALFVKDLSPGSELVVRSVGEGKAEFVLLDMTGDRVS
ncbi:hypothetical protein HDU96_009583 [Phlyctochytrium bullatum]|nr:hypothetical protein HDU96_009583 [Phlyctochytrium bullatum]